MSKHSTSWHHFTQVYQKTTNIDEAKTPTIKWPVLACHVPAGWWHDSPQLNPRQRRQNSWWGPKRLEESSCSNCSFWYILVTSNWKIGKNRSIVKLGLETSQIIIPNVLTHAACIQHEQPTEWIWIRLLPSLGFTQRNRNKEETRCVWHVWLYRA